MPAIPDAALGAIVAAILAAVISLLGLIISKEQKTSEFRQAWIDALRVDLSNYLTHLNAVQDALQVVYESQATKVASLHPHYVPLNAATFNILLRVNPEEKRSKALLECLGRFVRLAGDESDMNVANIKPIQADFLIASQQLLKSEWKRVKSGEPTFRVAKWMALIVVAGCLAIAVYLTVQPTGTDRPTAVHQAIRTNAKTIHRASSVMRSDRITAVGKPVSNNISTP